MVLNEDLMGIDRYKVPQQLAKIRTWRNISSGAGKDGHRQSRGGTPVLAKDPAAA